MITPKIRFILSVQIVAVALWLGTLGARAEDNTTNIFNAVTNDLSGGTLTVGQNGSNNVLIVSQSGSVFDNTGIIGNGSNANNNTAWITDPGSVWSNSGSLFIAAGAPATVYYLGIIGGGTVVSNGPAGGYGNALLVANHARVYAMGANIGMGGAGAGGGAGGDGGSGNNVTFLGLGSLLANQGELSLGRGGDGARAGIGGQGNRLVVSNGAVVSSVSTSLGEAGASNGSSGGIGGSDNSVIITGVGTVFSNNASLTLGLGGLGLNGTNGATGGNGNSLTAYSGGAGYSFAGKIDAEAADNQRWERDYSNSVAVSVGVGASGKNGGRGGDHNSVVLSGPGANWHSGADLLVGGGGYGVNFTDGIYLGGTNNDASSGGGGADNFLIVTNGGKFYSVSTSVGAGGNGGDYAARMGADAIGGTGGDHNYLEVSGAGSVLSNSVDLNLGAGGRLGVSGQLTSGAQGGTGGNGNRIMIANGGCLYCVNCNIGNRQSTFGGSSNCAFITGTGARLQCSAAIMMGAGPYGANGLVVSNGGSVSCMTGILGEGSNNFALVVGAGSVWSNSLNLNLGANLSLNNNLIVSNGGSLVCANELIGSYNALWDGSFLVDTPTPIPASGSNNLQIICGSGSVARIAGDLQIGKGHDGAFQEYGVAGGDHNGVIIADGGRLSSTNGFIGAGGSGCAYSGGQIYYQSGSGGGGGSSNRVIIAGASSVWNNFGDIRIGVAGSGPGAGGGGQGNSLSATNAGVVLVGGVVQVGSWSTGSNSQLIAVDGGQILVTNRSGTGTIDIQNGSLLVQGGAVTVNKLCATNGVSSVLQFPAGLLDIGSALVANGVPFVVGDGRSSATMRLRGGTSVFADGLIIASNAVLTGTGTIYGDVKVYGTVARTVTIIAGIGGTLNATDLTWHTGGDATWYRQTATTHDGGAALRSGAISAGQQSYFQTTTNGPGSLSFWWKVSSAAGNTLQFYIDTQLVSQISGNVDWNQYVGFIGTSNPVTLKWVYTKNSAVAPTSDAGFVDQVTWMPCPYATHVPQVFYQDPTGLLASWVLNSTGGMQIARTLANTGGYALKAAGDIDGDGVSDLLFETAGGATAVWFMNADGSVRSSRALLSMPGYEIKACGDYEGTGHAQLFVQAMSTAGNVYYLPLDNTGSNLSMVSVGAMGGWKLRGMGDLDGDGKAELIWQDAGGNMSIWYHTSNGGVRATPVVNMGTWLVCGLVDIDGNGTPDLLWQNPGGSTAAWFMNAGTTNGTARAASAVWSTGAWKLKAAGR